MFKIDGIDLNDTIDGINYMLKVVFNQTGASPSTASFLLSTIGKQNFNLKRFNEKVDSKIYDTAMVIMYLLRHKYLEIMEILEEVVQKNQKLLVDISKKDGL